MRSSLVPILTVIGATVLLVALLFAIRRTPEESTPPRAAPLVRTTTAEAGPYRFRVTAHGSVQPRSESELVPQVSGEIVWVSPSLAAGGFFEQDEPLARIDDADQRVELETAGATVARAESDYDRAHKELDRQRRLADRSVASQAHIDDAVNAFKVAEAVLAEARARYERAERDLSRTELRAPYRGRVRSEQVDVGQFVERGKPIATLYAVDYAEVRLPLPDRELAYLDVPLIPERALEDAARASAHVSKSAATDHDEAPIVDEGVSEGPRVHLEAEFAGALHHWEGTLVRTEAELDPRSRMVHVVARVPDPYGLERPRGAPLPVGLFVEARIEGREVEHAIVLPRDVLRSDGRIYVVDDEDRLRFRDVEILRTERDHVVLAGGIRDGERVCTSPLEAAIDGMRVRVSGEAERPGDVAAEDVAGPDDGPIASEPSTPLPLDGLPAAALSAARGSARSLARAPRPDAPVAGAIP